MVHIIGVNASTCTQRVLTVLAEKGVTDFTLYAPNFMVGEHKQPAHTAKQPFGVVPVLEDGDFTVYESRAICRYIAAKYKDQGPKLIPDPSDLKASILFEQWASVEKDNWDVYASELVGQKYFGPMFGRTPVQAIVDDRTTKLKEKLVIFDKILGAQKYMGGNEFSLIDIFYLPYTEKLYEIGDGNFIDEHPNVKAWWERVSTRDSWSKVKLYKLSAPQ